jgi:hypothetical protein
MNMGSRPTGLGVRLTADGRRQEKNSGKTKGRESGKSLFSLFVFEQSKICPK